MTEEKSKTPYGSTGSMDTTPNSLRSLVDWLGVTFLRVQKWEKVAQILCIDKSEFIVQNKGFNGYSNTVTFGSIKIAYNENGNHSMGTHLSMSGQACREFEKLFDLQLNWSLFFKSLLSHTINVSRLDIAIDDFEGYFTIDQLYKTAKKGNMTATRITKARRFEEFFIDTGDTCGQTFYIGKTNWVIRFYDKLAERINKNQEVTVGFWNRYEIQLRSKVAYGAIEHIAYHDTELGVFVRGFLTAKIDFKIKNKTDTNKSRWKSKKWWLKFLDDVEAIPLTQQAPDMTIEKKYKWIDKQVSRSFYMLTEAFPDEENLIDYIKLKGKQSIERNHIREIEEFKNSEMSQIISDEMDVFLEQRKKDFLGTHL